MLGMIGSLSGQEIEAGDVSGANDREVPSIDCCNLVEIETFSGGYYRCVHRPKRQFPVLAHEFGDAQPVSCCHGIDRELARGQITQETHFCFRAESGSDEVDHLGDHQGWNDEGTGMGQQEIEGVMMVTVVGVDVGVKRPGVYEESYLATSATRISSMRSEMSSRPLRPAPAARRRRSFPPRWASMASRVSSETGMPRRLASWRSLASTSSGSLTVVLFIGMPAYPTRRTSPMMRNQLRSPSDVMKRGASPLPSRRFQEPRAPTPSRCNRVAIGGSWAPPDTPGNGQYPWWARGDLNPHGCYPTGT